MSYAKYGTNRSYELETKESDYVGEEYVYYGQDGYGLIEDFNKRNCYGVEDVYNDLEEWN